MLRQPATSIDLSKRPSPNVIGLRQRPTLAPQRFSQQSPDLRSLCYLRILLCLPGMDVSYLKSSVRLAVVMPTLREARGVYKQRQVL